MAKRKIYLDEISVDYSDVNSNPYFNQQNYAKVEEPKKKVNNSYKPSKTTKNSSVTSGEYAVQKGDSLWKIAKQHGTTVEALRAANPEIKGNMIYPNQIINIGSNSTQNSKPITKQTNNTTAKNNTSKQPRLATVNTNTQFEPIRRVEVFKFNNYVDRPNNIIPQSVEDAIYLDANDKAIHLSSNMYNLTGQNVYNDALAMYQNPKRSNKQSNTKSTKNTSQIRRDNIVKRTNERQEQVHKYDRKFTLKDIKPKISQRVQLKPVVITAKGTPRKETNWDYLGLKR